MADEEGRISDVEFMAQLEERLSRSGQSLVVADRGLVAFGKYFTLIFGVMFIVASFVLGFDLKNFVGELEQRRGEINDLKEEITKLAADTEKQFQQQKASYEASLKTAEQLSRLTEDAEERSNRHLRQSMRTFVRYLTAASPRENSRELSDFLQQNIDFAEQQNLYGLKTELLAGLGQTLWSTDPRAAGAAFEEAVALAEAQGDQALAADILIQYGDLQLRQYPDSLERSPMQANLNFRRALALYEQLGDKEGMAVAYYSIADSLESDGESKQAMVSYQKARELHLGLPGTRAEEELLVVLRLANLTKQAGDRAEAQRLYREAISIAEALDKLHDAVSASLEAARLASEDNQRSVLLCDALDLFKRAPEPKRESWINGKVEAIDPAFSAESCGKGGG